MSNDKDGEKEENVVKEAFEKWMGLFFVLIAAVVVYFLVKNISYIWGVASYLIGILRPVIYGCVMAYVLNPLMNMYLRLIYKIFAKFGRQIGVKGRKAATAAALILSILTGVLVIVALFILVIPQIVESVLALINALPAQADAFYRRMVHSIENNRFIADRMQEAAIQITNYLDEAVNTELLPWLKTVLLPNLNTFAKHMASATASVFNVFYNVFVGLIVAIYLLGGKRVFLAQSKKILYGLFKKKHADVIMHYVRISNDMFSGFISGKIIDSAIIGILCFIAMSIFGLQYAVLISVVVGVTNVIPVFGPYIGAIPGVLLLLLVSPGQALGFLVLILILQQLDGNLIGPAILGESTGLSAFWVLFSILFFGGIWGVLGMLVGCPMFAVIYRVIKDFVEMRLGRKELLTDTDDYLDLKDIEVTDSGVEYLKFSDDEINGKRKKGKSGALGAVSKKIGLLKDGAVRLAKKSGGGKD